MISDRRNSFSDCAALLASAAVIAIAIAGCGWVDSSEDREVISTPGWPSPTTSGVDPVVEETRSPSKAEVARDRALAAYRGMWVDLLAAARTSDWDSPRLDDHATRSALEDLSLRLRADHDRGVVAKGRIDQSPVARSSYAEPKAVQIIDCVDDLKWLTYKADTGELVDEPRGRHRVMALVTLQPDNTWKVFRFSMDEVGTC